MRWIFREAKIDPEFRKTFEQYGTLGMQVVLALGGNVKHQSQRIPVDEMMIDVLSWLTEQYHRAEVKETWSLTMEVAITVFVLGELLLSICRLHS
jgi:hypothetical protein